MKKFKQSFKIIVFLAISLALVFFPQFFQKEKAFSATFSSPTNQLRLVGYNGYQPASYFDSLEKAKVGAPSNSYYNSNGVLTKTYNIISADNANLFNAKSTGSLSFKPFNDYITLANKNVLYAYAQVGIVAGSGEKNDVTISLSHNQTTVTSTNSSKGLTNPLGEYNPHYFKTAPILIKSNKNIEFSFSNNASASIWSKADFKLFEPSIIFTTKIDQITFQNSSQTVYANQILKLEASNSILDIQENTSLISHYKGLHKIEYEIVEGADKASVIGDYLYFTGESSGTVKIRAKALEQSNANKFIYSQTVTYNYIAEQKTISASLNFPNSATVVGTGSYYLNQPATLIATVNQNYIFSHWLYNGQKITTPTLSFTVQQVNNIELYTIKKVEINKIVIKQRQYDGTTIAEIESVQIDGILPFHKAQVNNLQASYYTASAGTKVVLFNQSPILDGEDAKWYRLSETLPSTTGIIKPKDITLTLNNFSKIYGDNDPQFSFTESGVLEEDNLDVVLSRTKGEDVGDYQIFAQVNNSNYNAVIETGNLTILQREVFLKTTQFEKVYSKEKDAIFSSDLMQLQNLDTVTATINASFEHENLQTAKKLTINNITLEGENSNNYFINNEIEIFGTITAKQLMVSIENKTKIYGQKNESFSYTIVGAIDGDLLYEEVVRQAGENVGEYLLFLQIQNSNYIVNLQGAPKLFIVPKPAEINAFYTSKVYGEDDPKILYETNDLIWDDVLEGQLSRQTGENVGQYDIKLGTLKNNNYNLTLISNIFEIKKLNLTGSLSFQSKVYDGTKNLNGYQYLFSNIISNDDVKLEIEAQFKTTDVSENVLIEIFSVEVSNENYAFIVETYTAQITPRTVYLYAQETTKVYGDDDPEIEFTTENLINNDVLNGKLSRMDGEDFGNYQINQGTLTSENNPNYNIVLASNSIFEISKRIVNITTLSQEKYFGEQDPNPSFGFYSANDKLAFEHKLIDILNGSASRVEGSLPGRYSYLSANISSLNSNYILNYIPSGALTILKANIIVRALSITKIYGEIDPAFDYEVNKQVIENFSFELIREQGENVGSYAITYLSLYNEFYNISYEEGFLTILPRELAIKPIEQTKFYGDNDPQVAFTIVSGILINGDTLNNILSGQAKRIAGENVGSYEICVGTLNTNQNYSLIFEKSNLVILKQEILIMADNKTKQFGQEDEILTYTIKKGFLAFSDTPTGTLKRTLGEEIGEYEINQGTFNLTNNYSLSFINGLFTIKKAEILVVANSLEKEYGDADFEINFEIMGNYYSEYTLQGEIIRQAGEDVGTYNFISTLSSPYYEISYSLGALTINKRVIKIKAKSYSITYGEPVPSLEYEISYGTILPADTLSGNIYKVSGNNAGVYDINSTLNLGRNYQIEYTKGTVTILPASIKIISDGASKIYGQADPLIPYSILQGELLQGDVLTGKLSRVAGEDIGTYQLLPAFTNSNYVVEVLTGKFEIIPKVVHLYIVVEDKVFDDNDKAIIRKAEVIGVNDSTVSLYYDKFESAIFADKQIGNKVQILLSNIFLIGEKAFNYILEIPQVFANITYNQLENSNITVFAEDNTQIVYGTQLQVSNYDLDKPKTLNNQKVISTYNINLTNNNQALDLEQKITISINLQNTNHQNVKVYLVDENNNATLINSNFKNGNLMFSTNQLGNVIIVADNLIWLDIATVLSATFLGLLCLGFIFKKIRQSKKAVK